MSEPVRLSRRIVALTSCSRREAELYIEGGWVLVDGQVVEEPQFMITGQKVELRPGAKAEAVEPITILLHKPAGYDSNQGDRPAVELLKAGSRLIEAGGSPVQALKRHFVRLGVPMPLENTSSGLLVLTQDWQVMRRLTEDAARIEQEYVVEVAGTVAADGLSRLNRGFDGEISSHGRPIAACKVSWQSETRLRFACKAVQHGQLESLCAAVGLQAISIRRIRIGSIAMSKMLPGQWRYLAANQRF